MPTFSPSLAVILFLASIAASIPQSSNADDYVHLKSQSHEVSTESNVEYTIVPVLSLAFADRHGFIFQRWTDKDGKELRRVRSQYRLKIEDESNGNQVLRIFNRDKQTEYGLLQPAEDDKLGKVLVYNANKDVKGKNVEYNIVFKNEMPDRSYKTFLNGFVSGIEKPDRDATEQMLRVWFE